MKNIGKRFYLYFFLASAAIAGVLSFYASSNPDGLEKVADDHGFLANAKDSAVSGSPLSDYSFAGIENERLSVAISGLIGIAVTGAIAFGVFLLLKRAKSRVEQ